MRKNKHWIIFGVCVSKKEGEIAALEFLLTQQAHPFPQVIDDHVVIKFEL